MGLTDRHALLLAVGAQFALTVLAELPGALPVVAGTALTVGALNVRHDRRQTARWAVAVAVMTAAVGAPLLLPATRSAEDAAAIWLRRSVGVGGAAMVALRLLQTRGAVAIARAATGPLMRARSATGRRVGAVAIELAILLPGAYRRGHATTEAIRVRFSRDTRHRIRATLRAVLTPLAARSEARTGGLLARNLDREFDR